MQKVIEALESRIAPAAIFTYTESDGDVISVKTSANVTSEYFESLATFSLDTGDLTHLELSDPAFRNTNLTITVEQVAGNGRASIGDIDADVDLKNVIINGDVASIDVGDNNYATVGLSKLQVHNLGVADDDDFFDTDSDFRGGVKTIKILGDLLGDIYAGSYEEGNGIGSLNTITVAGSVGEDAYISARKIGSFVVTNDMGGEIDARQIKSVRIGGNLFGTQENSGVIYGESIKSVRIGGSILGGSAYSGGISAEVIGTVIVGGDIVGGDGGHSGYVFGDEEIGKVIVLGNLLGGAGDMSGIIESEGDVGLVRVDGDVVAGAGDLSGSIALVYHEDYYDEYFDPETEEYHYDVALEYFDAEGHAGKIIVGGSLLGAVEVEVEPEVFELVGGADSGTIVASYIGSLRVGGSVVGGANYNSGSIFGDYLTSAYIGGSLIGGENNNAGSILFEGIGSIRVVENMIGGSGFGSGGILAYAGISSVKIGGNLEGGAASGSGSIGAEFGSIDSIVIGGSLSNPATLEDGTTGIYAGGSIGRVSIGAGVTGSEYGTLGIRAGFDHFGNTSVPSIGNVTIKGDVVNFLIEAGINYFGDVNPGASIGSVNITGNFTSSTIAAGVGAGGDGFYGTSDDVLPTDPSLISRIANVVIGGVASGTPAATNSLDGYGIFAQHIVAAKINGTKLTLNPAPSDDLVAQIFGGTGDFRVVELPASILV